MTTTLSRRIRRIGILPTTFKTSKEDRLVKDDAGNEVIQTTTKKTPIRHFERIANDVRAEMEAKLRAEAGVKRTAWKAVESGRKIATPNKLKK